jgi:hypothetical protein
VSSVHYSRYLHSFVFADNPDFLCKKTRLLPKLAKTTTMPPIAELKPPMAPPKGDGSQQQDAPMGGKPLVGIIYPPPEVRNIVDKTASFVARNGPEFESRIRQNEANNAKFNFLTTTDPYHAYYKHKVNCRLAGLRSETLNLS